MAPYFYLYSSQDTNKHNDTTWPRVFFFFFFLFDCLLDSDEINIGVGRFRILGGQGLEYWGGGAKGAKVPAGTWHRNDVDAT